MGKILHFERLTEDQRQRTIEFDRCLDHLKDHYDELMCHLEQVFLGKTSITPHIIDPVHHVDDKWFALNTHTGVMTFNGPYINPNYKAGKRMTALICIKYLNENYDTKIDQSFSTPLFLRMFSNVTHRTAVKTYRESLSP